MVTLTATAVIEKSEDGYYAYVPQLAGCLSQGDTLEEVMQNIQEAFELYVETIDNEDIRQILSSKVLITILETEID